MSRDDEQKTGKRSLRQGETVKEVTVCPLPPPVRTEPNGNIENIHGQPGTRLDQRPAQQPAPAAFLSHCQVLCQPLRLDVPKMTVPVGTLEGQTARQCLQSHVLPLPALPPLRFGVWCLYSYYSRKKLPSNSSKAWPP